MKKSLYNIILIVGLAVLITSCGKEAELSKIQMLTNATWIYAGGASTSQSISTLLPLLANSSYKFYPSGDYAYLYQAVGVPGKWEFNSDQTEIIFGKGTVNERTVRIVTLEVSTLTFEEVDGSDMTTYSYLKQN